MKQLTELNSWIDLKKHAQSLHFATISHLKQSPSRNKSLRLSTQNICIDFSSQRINETTIQLLLNLAQERHLKKQINALIQGEPVNLSENSPALHTALRHFGETEIRVNNQDIIPEIMATREEMRRISEQIRAKKWFGFSGKAITDIVNIGIGGSDLGPRFCIKVLSEFLSPELGYHFVSDVDPYAFKNAVAGLSPETTLFIISSKSFSTQETLYNAQKALAWINRPQQIDKHFIAVTANGKKAKELGFNHILPVWGWVGGRYSLCSAINLITAIGIGFEQFTQLLAGAHNMDLHFQHTDFNHNLPVILALIGIWNNNLLHIHNLLVLTYAQQLEYFVPYIQQLDMESNGKSIDNQRRVVNHATGPMIWGGLGNQAQHSYYQLLCQGTHRLTVDFITAKQFSGQMINKICDGKRKILADGILNPSNPDGYIPGNIPLNNIILKDCSPFSIGELIALYEHKVYIQSIIWNINPFDQPGVESAKYAVNSMAAHEIKNG